MTRVSQETGSAAYSNHVPGGERRSFRHVCSFRPFHGRISLARVCLRSLDACRLSVAYSFCDLSPLPAQAVVVRGVVTDPLGLPVSGCHVQLVQGQKAVAIGIAGVDGSYEIRSTQSGRFVLLTSSATFSPGISEDFYGGSTDESTQNIVLEVGSVHAEVTVTATGMPTPVAQVELARLR